MASPLAISPGLTPPAQLMLVSQQPQIFNAAFIDRRMRLHKQWQNRTTEAMVREVYAEIADEVADGIRRGADTIRRQS
jgi:hypothetical protein